MNPNLLHILQHSLGCDQFGRSTSATPPCDEGDGCFGYYRNRFVTDPDCADGLGCTELVTLGMMHDHGAQSLAAGMHCYTVTQAGVQAMREHSPKPPKLTRSQERYRRYRDVSECFKNFRAFLEYEKHQRKGLV